MSNYQNVEDMLNLIKERTVQISTNITSIENKKNSAKTHNLKSRHKSIWFNEHSQIKDKGQAIADDVAKLIDFYNIPKDSSNDTQHSIINDVLRLNEVVKQYKMKVINDVSASEKQNIEQALNYMDIQLKDGLEMCKEDILKLETDIKDSVLLLKLDVVDINPLITLRTHSNLEEVIFYKDFECQDASITRMLKEQHQRIVKHFETTLENLKKQHNESINSEFISNKNGSATKNNYRHLKQQEIDLIWMLRKEYVSKNANAKNSNGSSSLFILDKRMYLDRLLLEFPRYKQSELEALDLIFDNITHCREKNKAIVEQYRFVMAHHIEKTKKMFKETNDLIASKTVMKHKMAEQQKICESLTKTKTLLNEEKKKQQAKQRLIEQEKFSQLQKLNIKKQDKKLHEQKKKFELLQIYNEGKQKLRTEQQKRQKMIEEKMEIHHQKQEEYNSTRVEYRKQKELEKQQEHERKLEVEKQKQDMLAANLKKLRESVAISIESDWERILQDTESMKAIKYEKHIPYGKQYGYTTEKILQDPRAKLSSIFHSAGVLHNSYAQELLLKMTTNAQRNK